MSITRNLLSVANTWLQNQIFSGTNNTAPSQTAASGSSLMTRALVDSRIAFQGPYVSHFVLGAGIVYTGTGGAAANGATVWGVGNGSTPTAGVSAASIQSSPSIGLPFMVQDNTVGASTPSSGQGGVVNFSNPFTIGFFLDIRGGPTNALDVISRVYLGNANIASGVSTGISNAGFGLRIWRASSTTYNLALYCRTHSTTNTNISGATNASPIVITNNGHGLQNGDLVDVAGVVGNTAANGIWTIANSTANTFELSGSTGNGAYASGGVANKITSPITIQAGRVRRVFLFNDGSGNVSLFLGSPANAASLTITGMNTFSTTSFTTQTISFGLSQQSVTDATAFAQTVISNTMLIQP